MADAKKWVSVGLRFVPYLGQIMQGIEAVKSAKGAEKAVAFEEAFMNGLEAAEFALDKDILADEGVRAAAQSYREAYVSLQNAIAASKAVRVKPAA